MTWCRSVRRLSVVVVFLVAALASLRAGAKPRNERDQTKEQAYAALLGDRPDLVATFHAATVKMDAGDAAGAEAGFAAVVKEAPTHGPSLWRLSALARAGDRTGQAIEWARRAVAAYPQWPAPLTLMEALGARGTPSHQYQEALRLMEELRRTNEGPELEVSIGQMALAHDAEWLFSEAQQRLARLAPDSFQSAYFNFIIARIDESWDGMKIALADMERRGATPEMLAKLREQSGLNAHERNSYLVSFAVAGFVLWLLLLGGIFLGGSLLSTRTLRAVEAVGQPSAGGSPSPDRFAAIRQKTEGLRRTYGYLLTFAGGYYYLSVVVVMALVLGLAGGAIYGLLWLGHVPVKLVLLLALGAIATVWAMLKSLFVRRAADEDPGRRLLPAEAPALFAVLNDTAARVSTRPVDEVFLTMGVEVAVLERGPVTERLRGQGRRTLVLGVGVLEGLTQRQLRGILAHEYGHFSNRDTVKAHTGTVVQASILKSLVGIAQSGHANALNVAWHFMRLYYAIFLRISLGASRLREYMADQLAAASYGPRAFADGLTHVVRRSVLFDATAQHWVTSAERSRAPIANLYSSPREEENGAAVKTEEIEQAVRDRMAAEGSPYDSHPPPGKRIAWVERLGGEEPVIADGESPAWELLPARESLESEMTTQANRRLVAEGIIDWPPAATSPGTMTMTPGGDLLLNRRPGA